MNSILDQQRKPWFSAMLGAFIAIVQVLAVGFTAIELVEMLTKPEEYGYYGVTVIFGGLFALVAATVVGAAAGIGILRKRRPAWKDWGIIFGVLIASGIIPLYSWVLVSPFISY